jgi:hypothetical protein
MIYDFLPPNVSKLIVFYEINYIFWHGNKEFSIFFEITTEISFYCDQINFK